MSLTKASKIDRSRIGARPSDGSSSSSSRGRLTSARPIATICCSPPLSRPAGWSEPLAHARKQLEHLVEAVGELAAPAAAQVAIGAELQVLLHRVLGKELASLGHQREPEIGDLVRRHAADVAAGELDAPFGRAQQPGEAAQRRGLAGAVAAEHGDDLARLDREGDALDHLELAVGDVQVARPQAAAWDGPR